MIVCRSYCIQLKEEERVVRSCNWRLPFLTSAATIFFTLQLTQIQPTKPQPTKPQPTQPTQLNQPNQTTTTTKPPLVKPFGNKFGLDSSAANMAEQPELKTVLDELQSKQLVVRRKAVSDLLQWLVNQHFMLPPEKPPVLPSPTQSQQPQSQPQPQPQPQPQSQSQPQPQPQPQLLQPSLKAQQTLSKFVTDALELCDSKGCWESRHGGFLAAKVWHRRCSQYHRYHESFSSAITIIFIATHHTGWTTAAWNSASIRCLDTVWFLWNVFFAQSFSFLFPCFFWPSLCVYCTST